MLPIVVYVTTINFALFQRVWEKVCIQRFQKEQNERLTFLWQYLTFSFQGMLCYHSPALKPLKDFSCLCSMPKLLFFSPYVPSIWASNRDKEFSGSVLQKQGPHYTFLQTDKKKKRKLHKQFILSILYTFKNFSARRPQPWWGLLR